MKRKSHKEITRAMREVNFERIHKAMTVLDWRWDLHNGEGLRVPTLKEIKKSARNRCEEAIWSHAGYSYSGGFEASYRDGSLSLRFILEEDLSRY